MKFGVKLNLKSHHVLIYFRLRFASCRHRTRSRVNIAARKQCALMRVRLRHAFIIYSLPRISSEATRIEPLQGSRTLNTFLKSFKSIEWYYFEVGSLCGRLKTCPNLR
jgi:hypothetical protein